LPFLTLTAPRLLLPDGGVGVSVDGLAPEDLREEGLNEVEEGEGEVEDGTPSVGHVVGGGKEDEAQEGGRGGGRGRRRGGGGGAAADGEACCQGGGRRRAVPVEEGGRFKGEGRGQAASTVVLREGVDTIRMG